MFEKINQTIKKFYNDLSIRSTVFISFTISTVLAVILISITLYRVFSLELEVRAKEENQIFLNQVNQTIDAYIRNMMKISDSIYYEVIKNVNLNDKSINEKLNLVFDINKDHLAYICLFDSDGNLLEVTPPGKIKTNINIKEKNWFITATEKTENLHFSLPSIHNIFLDSEYQYRWVLSLSRYVEITKNRTTENGVLLMEMKYTEIEQIMNKGKLGNKGYIYLVDDLGNIIYHPKYQLIDSNIIKENNIQNVSYKDGSYSEVFENEERNIIVKSVGYTGWKLIGVTLKNDLNINDLQNKIFIIFFVFLFVFLFSLMNLYISSKVTDPIKELEKSVLALENNLDENIIYIGGSNEVKHLGDSVKKMVNQMNQLMVDIVKESEAKKRSELNALQSQINPHFLYNTLDIIVWMVENENSKDAVRVVTALARLFRISLSKGKTIIVLEDELEHIKNYLMIQQMRFKNKFNFIIDAEPNTLNMSTIKLIIQPIVENSIYHGMEFMDGEGLIEIKTYIEKDNLYISILDNGFGIEKNILDNLLKKGNVQSKTGSGIGLNNIHERIQIYFGEDYGIEIKSELDEGTLVKIHLPAIKYEEENKEI